MKTALVFLSLFLFLQIPSNFLQAEAWLATRYAQNCSACHSPSRRNVKLLDRRCTLACQGCHVNPNGGGLRNQYGVWNQQRWLRSFTSKTMGSKKLPHPLKKQKYGKQPKKLSAKRGKKKYKKYLLKGAKLKGTLSAKYNEKDHDRSDKQEHITVKGWPEFMYRVTEEDPLRIERRRSVYGGGDFRMFYLSKYSAEDKSTFFPMAIDFGIRARPIKRYLSFVLEGRAQNSPGNQFDEIFDTTSLRSAYLFVDDLPLALFGMYGVYRPLFGHYTPDHESLSQAISGFDKNARYKALTLGGSPNVPFFNIHLIQPTTSGKDTFNANGGSEEGMAFNLGGRWVTMGASLMFSYWSTKRVSAPFKDAKRNLMSFNGGITFWKIILNGDLTLVDEENVNTGAKNKGSVTTVESKLRLWRENYLMLNYSMSNVNSMQDRLAEGSASELLLGVKSFLLPGMEFELASIARKDTLKSTGNKIDLSFLQAQMHVFF